MSIANRGLGSHEVVTLQLWELKNGASAIVRTRSFARGGKIFAGVMPENGTVPPLNL